MVRHALKLSLVAACIGAAWSAQAATLGGRSEALSRLSTQAGGAPQVVVDKATGSVRMLRVDAGARRGVLARAAATDASRHATSAQFLTRYADLFGIKDVAGELSAARFDKDRQGGTHVVYRQMYKGVPVFGGEIRTHFDASDNLTVVSGSFVPDLSLGTTPRRSADEAALAAVARAKSDLAERLPAASLARITASSPVLMVYREGLVQGVEGGATRLVWQVEVGNRLDARDFVFIDANTLKVVEKFSGIHDAKNRRAYDAAGSTAPGANYPGTPFWVEGQAFPTGNTEADNMIAASSDVYDLFKTAFGRDSFDGAGGKMDSIFNRGNNCPNASWNGLFISFCPGLTTDDVTAHEWAHAYTQYTHGLVYAWQPGALNEAYSDIWGETIDRINGRGTDLPNAPRTAGACTAFTNTTQVNLSAPSSIAGVRAAGTAAFGPQTFAVATNDVVVVNDGVGTANDGCETPFANAAAVAGKIAFVDRGTCGFAVKVKNAQLNGAIGVIVGNNQAGTINMSGTDATITIPSLSVLQVDGTAIKGASGVKASLQRGPGGDNSVRWLLGEDSTAVGLTGALRDMYNPTCYGNPGKVSDAQYSCGPNTQAGDNGGVHTNSGVPNHAYALLVDGGTYNGQTVSAIGLTKAAHIYWRAQTVYQGPLSGFAAHADAVEQSCRDLTGANLTDLKTGAASGEVITASDCTQVANAMAAVEMRVSPSQCNFTPLLAKAPPPLCPSGTQLNIATDSFDGGRKAGMKWAVTHTGPVNYDGKDWGVVSNLPSGRSGFAMFASNRDIGTCAAGGDATSLQRLETDTITIPADATTLRMAFDHWIATEAGYDGGNVKISVNGGAWQLVSAANFVYNPYNTTLVGSGNTNPLAGQAAFSGADGGALTGSWGRSIINLAPYAAPGNTIKLRFELGSDICGGSTTGWFVDDVQVYRCVAAP